MLLIYISLVFYLGSFFSVLHLFYILSVQLLASDQIVWFFTLPCHRTPVCFCNSLSDSSTRPVWIWQKWGWVDNPLTKVLPIRLVPSNPGWPSSPAIKPLLACALCSRPWPRKPHPPAASLLKMHCKGDKLSPQFEKRPPKEKDGKGSRHHASGNLHLALPFSGTKLWQGLIQALFCLKGCQGLLI